MSAVTKSDIVASAVSEIRLTDNFKKPFAFYLNERVLEPINFVFFSMRFRFSRSAADTEVLPIMYDVDCQTLFG